MDYRMVVDSELLDLSIPQRFISYAKAYCNGAIALTEKMITDITQSNWPNAAVVLMLSSHSVELFLKGALFAKNPTAKMDHHKIEVLFDLYCQEFPDDRFTFDMPFKTEYLGVSEAEILVLKKQNYPTPSVYYRYPTKTGEREWEGAAGFEAPSFLPVLEQLIEDYRRLEKCIT